MNLFSQIDEIVYYGNGYSWDVIYNMPVWLRKFTFHRLAKRINHNNKDLESQTKEIKSGKIELPQHFKQNKKNIPKY